MTDQVEIGDTRLRLVRGDITDQEVDAIVNAANSSLMGGGGVDGAIHRRGGAAILDACKRIRAEEHPDGLPTGQAVVTTAGDLPASVVIHTVGPRWKGGDAGEGELLASAYRSSLELAAEHGHTVVAFPSISTGVYGYPVEQAAEVAIATIRGVIGDRPGLFAEVRMVLFSDDHMAAYRKALARLT